MIQYVFTEIHFINLRRYVTSKILEDMGRIWKASSSRLKISTLSRAEGHNETRVLILPDKLRRTELHLLYFGSIMNNDALCVSQTYFESTSTFWFISVKGWCCWPSFWMFISLCNFYRWFPHDGNSKFLNPKLVCIYRPQNQRKYN
jgi:hypothetical protein